MTLRDKGGAFGQRAFLKFAHNIILLLFKTSGILSEVGAYGRLVGSLSSLSVGELKC